MVTEASQPTSSVVEGGPSSQVDLETPKAEGDDDSENEEEEQQQESQAEEEDDHAEGSMRTFETTGESS